MSPPRTRYQAFVSSTYIDLVKERQIVADALLRLDLFPAGMELFPSDTVHFWKLIQQSIEDSDFYILLVAGRYGSLNKQGVSYTEAEYDYARNKGLHILPFFSTCYNTDNPLAIEKDATILEKLSSFKRKVSANHAPQYWSSIEQLATVIATSTSQAVKKCNRPGWTRAAQTNPHPLAFSELNARHGDSLLNTHDIDALDIEKLSGTHSTRYETSYSVAIRIRTEINESRSDEDYIVDFDALLLNSYCDHEGESRNSIAGSASGSIVRAGDAFHDGWSNDDVFDAHSELSYELWSASAAWQRSRCPCSEISLKELVRERNFLIIDKISILPQHRGRRLGLLLARDVINCLASEFKLVLLYLAAATPIRTQPSAWEDALDMFSFNGTDEEQKSKVAKYFSMIGANRIGKSDFAAIYLLTDWDKKLHNI